MTYVMDIDNLKIQNSQFSIDSISFKPQITGVIRNSNFKKIQLLQGSVLNILGGLITISNSTFESIQSETSAAIYCSQTKSLLIQYSQFINTSCKYQKSLQKCLGGALYLQQIKTIKIIFSNYYNSFSSDYGGAIYINNQNNYFSQINNTIFNNCKVKNNSGGAIFIQQSKNISIYNSTFSNNSALLERGGAIGLYYSDLIELKNSIFLYNKAQIGGGIWYGPNNQTFLQDELYFKNNLFGKNEVFFYGEDIGSYPRKIQRVTSKSEEITSNQINQIQSGNLISEEIYFTFYDEQQKPLNFITSEKYPQSLEVQNELISYFLKVQIDKNPMIQIKQGQTLERRAELGVFQLQIQLLYKQNKTQLIQIQSNPLLNEYQLIYSLVLNFRDCIRGEIQQSQNGFIQCNPCQEGKYSLIEPNKSSIDNLVCQSCPSQAIQCLKDSIVLRDGFWRESLFTDQIYSCQTDGCSETQLRVIDRCLEGYIGPLCDSCDGSKQIWGDYYGKKGKYCILCKQLKYQYIYFTVFLICYSIYLTLCVGDLIDQKIFIIKLILFRKIDLLITSKSCSQGETVTFWIKIFVHYLQISSLIFSFGIQYPYELSAPVNTFGDPTNFTLTSLDCLFPLSQNYPIWLHRLIIQITSLVIQYILVNVLYYFLYLTNSYNKAYKKKFIKTCLKTSFVFFYLFYQPSITKIIFSGIFCKQIGSQYRLISDLNQECYTDTHIILVLSVILPLCLFWCLLIPLFLNIKLQSIKQHVDQIKQIEQVIIYGIIYQGYKIKCFNWEIIKIFQKLILMIVINSNLSDIIKITFIIVILLLYTVYLVIKQPHKNIKLMNCEKMMMVLLNFNFLFLLMIIKESNPYYYVLILGYILIFLCNIIAVICFIYLLSNSMVIRLCDDYTSSTKVKNALYKLSQSFPKLFRHLKFRKVNVYRIHKLWKLIKKFIKNENSSNPNKKDNIKQLIKENITAQSYSLAESALKNVNSVLIVRIAYYEFKGNSCARSCEVGYYESNYFRQCKLCKVNNCKICNDAQICLECKQGWVLDEKRNTCQNEKCISEEGTYYQEETDTCKYYCKEGYDENSMQCIKFKKLGDYEAEMIRIDQQQGNIIQMQAIKIEDQNTVIAIDLQRAVYYKYPELIPYFEIAYNQTAYFAHIRGNYILVIYSDQNKIARINAQTKKIDYYQLGQCDNPLVQQNYLICQYIQYNALIMIDLDNPLFKIFQFQPQARIIQEVLSNENNLRQAFNQQTPAEIESQSNKEYKNQSVNQVNKQNRNLQDLPQNQDQLGCYINYPKQFDAQPKQITNVLKNRTIQIIQEYSKIEDTQHFNFFILEEISMLLYFDKISQKLYSLDSKNVQSIIMTIQLYNTSQVLCSQYFNNTIHLLLADQNYSNVGYYLTSTFDSGYYQFNQANAIKIQDVELGDLQNCLFLAQFQTLLLQGQNGYLRIKTSEIQQISKKSAFYKNEFIISNTNSYIFTFLLDKANYTINIYEIDDSIFKIFNQFNFDVQQYYFSDTPSKFTFLYDDLEKNIVLSYRNEMQLIRLLPKQDQVSQVFSRYAGGKIRQNFGQIITIFNLEIEDGICIIYQFGFNIIFGKTTTSSIARYLDFTIEIYDQKDNYLVLGSNLQKKIVIFDIYLQQFNELNYEIQQFQKLFIAKSSEYLIVAISLMNGTFNLYTINGKQSINGYSLNYNLLQQGYTPTIQSFYNQLYIISDQQTVLIYKLQDQLSFLTSFYYSQYFQVVGPNVIFQFSKCKENSDTYLTVFNILNQSTYFILFQVEDISYQKIQVTQYLRYAKILFQSGRYKVKIFDMGNQSFIEKPPQTDLNNSLLVDRYIIYLLGQSCYIFDMQTLEETQVSFPTYPNIQNYFMISNQPYFLVYFPNLEKSLVFNISNQQFQQAVNVEQSQNSKFVIKNEEILIFDQNKTQKIIPYFSLALKQVNRNNKCRQINMVLVFLQLTVLLYNQRNGISFDDKSNILVFQTVSQDTLNFYLLNSDVLLSVQIEKYRYMPSFQFYNFEEYSLVLITMSAKEAYFINYEQGIIFKFENGGQKIKFSDGLFIQDKYIVTFEYQFIYKFQIQQGDIKLIKQYQPSIDFLEIYNQYSNQLTLAYNFESNQLILVNLQKYIMSFDLDTFVNVCQQQYQQVLGFVYFQEQNIVISLKTSSFTILYLNSCIVKSQNLMGITFTAQPQLNVQYNLNIFLIKTSDLLVLVSTNGLEVYQFSTLNYLITNNYKYDNKYTQIQSFILEDSNEIILTTTDNQIQIYDLATSLFYNPKFLDTSFENNFVYFNELNIVSYLNQNSGNEYHIVDVQNYSYDIYKISFRCLKVKNQNFNIFCLNEMSQIYKLNLASFKFDLIFNQISEQSITDIEVLSDDFLMIQQKNRTFIIFQISTKKQSKETDLISSALKISMVNNLIGIQTRQKISIYFIGSGDSQQLNIQQIYEQNNKMYIQSFTIIKTINSYQLIYSTQETTFIYDIFQNYQIGTMKNAAQSKQRVFTDDKFIYIVGISNLILYDQNTLQTINYYSVNQFVYSSIQNVIHVDEDYFILILEQQLILAKINLKCNNLIQTFSNLINAAILQIEKTYNSQKQLSAIYIYGHTDSNLFKLEVSKLDNNLNSREVSLEVLYKETQIQAQQMHFQKQTEVQKQNKVVGSYILSFEKQEQQQIGDIPIYYNQIFTNYTLLQIQSATSIVDKVVSLVINDNKFSQLKFKRILFFNIELYIQPSQEQLILNPLQKVEKIIFDKVYLRFFDESQSLVINDCKQLIWQEVIIQNQTLRRKYIPLQIQNIDQIKIDQLFVDNIKTSSVNDGIYFINITSIVIDRIIVNNSSFSSNLLKFYNCSNILINEIIIKNTLITRGSMFYFEKIDILNITKLNAQLDKTLNKLYKDQIFDSQEKQNINSDDLKIYLLTLKGCFSNYLSNFQVDSQINTGIIKSLYSLQDLKNPSFTYLVVMKNITVTNFVFKQDYQLFDLIGYIIVFDNLQIINSQFMMDSISIRASQKGVIQNSFFKGINLFNGSIFSLQGPDLLFRNTTFQNISSQSTAAIYCFQSNTLQIQQSKFIDIKCESQSLQQKCMGGSLNLQQINNLFINGYFDNSISDNYGGAIYINKQNDYSTQIQSSIFNNCKAKNGSGGAIYIQESENISIYNSTFSNNSALQERGGALALFYSNLISMNSSTFIHNQAQIGGGIWYGPFNQTLMKDLNLLTNNKFQENEGFFYGQDIGSQPQYIQRITKNFEQIQNNQLEDIQSGNLMDQGVYFTFFDEQNKPFDFIKSEQHIQSLEVQNERLSYFMKVSTDQNPHILIKIGQNLEKISQLGLFKLQISTSYSHSKEQKIQIKSNPLMNQRELFYNLTLKFRDCQRGEIQQSHNGFIECNQCQEGKYSLVEPGQINQNDLICQSCPFQAIKCFKDVIILKDGYWRENNLTDQIYQCQSHGCSETQNGVQDRCLEGYIGPLCDTCDTSKQVWGDYYGKKDSYCFKCKEIKYQYIFFSVILLVYSIYLVICIGDLIEQKVFIIKLLLFKQIDLLMTSKSSSQGETVTLWFKIFIHYIQITSLIFSFQIKQPYELSVPVKAFGDPTSLTITSMDCLIHTSQNYPFWIHRLVVQIINFAIQYIVVMAFYYFFYLRGSYHANLTKKLWNTGLQTTFVFFYLFYWPSIAKLILSGYFCRQIGEKYYLIQDLNQQCFTSSHIILVLSFVTPLCLLWCLLIPFYINKQLQKIIQYVDKIKNIQQIIVYGIFYQGYRIQCYNWEIIKIFQKFILMIVINSNFSDIIKIALIIVVLLLYTIFLSVKKPHKNIKLMNCEKIMVAILNFNFLFLLLILNESDPSYAVLVTGYILIIICNVIAISSFVLLLSNSLVIRLNDENSTSTKIKKLLYRLWKAFPQALKFIKFRKVNQYKTHKHWRHIKNFVYKQNTGDSLSKSNILIVNYKNNKKPILSSLNNLKSDRMDQLDQDQQNFIFSSEQIDERVENMATKGNETSYKGGLGSQKEIQLTTLNQIFNRDKMQK
ncbi:right-handed beta helix region protein (macronuclear) [Tetrahymena thermophila SB210]|uniref:Right-handed beta helix region protein n=1 Tax=Tetrahymena thermophila (strain SB210) TaxID=312017 RepID=Q22LP4_TETTS|nr:right-handed beta helix region protein [Tetrahymena thermophila SB210]EAR86222.2 right-handed beta helix region protein [Tetrahymena thermophila SB210]|eukprot:XP_976817.2 right-handed beta helix region protein [Tetrahymena thermophila SB210]